MQASLMVSRTSFSEEVIVPMDASIPSLIKEQWVSVGWPQLESSSFGGGFWSLDLLTLQQDLFELILVTIKDMGMGVLLSTAWLFFI